MSLRDHTFAAACTRYDQHAAQYERILRQLFPELGWRVARYQMLVDEAKIRPNVCPPAWLLIEASRKDRQAHHSMELDLDFVARVSDVASLLAVIGGRLKDALARYRPQR